jgi:serine/threonine protein kinase
LVILFLLDLGSRDFKLANIFVDAGPTLVIGDFGFAKSGTDLAQTNLGTPLTMAPEVLENKGTYTSTADLWSIGAVFWNFLFGDYPFSKIIPHGP